MPNWCNNNISISGDYKELEKLLNDSLQNGFCQTVIPISDSDHPSSKWGTKWEVEFEFSDLSGEEGEEGNLWLDFNSAWCPPMDVIKVLAEKYAVEGWFVEPGVAYAGQIESDGGGKYTLKEWDDVRVLSDIPEKDRDIVIDSLESWLSDEEDFMEEDE